MKTVLMMFVLVVSWVCVFGQEVPEYRIEKISGCIYCISEDSAFGGIVKYSNCKSAAKIISKNSKYFDFLNELFGTRGIKKFNSKNLICNEVDESSDYKLHFSNKNFLSIAIYEEENASPWGGSGEGIIIKTYNFDLKQKKDLQFSDIFKKDSLEKLYTLLYNEYEYFNQHSEDLKSEKKELETKNPSNTYYDYFKTNILEKSFNISNKKIIFYRHIDSGSFSSFADFDYPIEDLVPWINEEVLKLLEVNIPQNKPYKKIEFRRTKRTKGL